MLTTITLLTQGELAILRLKREHGNAINADMVEDLTDACRHVDSSAAIRGVLLAASGKLFSPGLDLQELIELDRPQMERFLVRFNECVLALYSLAKPMVAAVHGHAVAGGCVLALMADWRVLREGALIGLNEVRVGLPLPYGVAQIVQAAVAPSRVEEVALFGGNFSDERAVAAGLAHELHGAEGFEEHCMGRLRELAEKGSQATAPTKRYLRSSVIERIRAAGTRHDAEFLDAWFSSETQQRVRGIVAGLRSRER